MAVALVLAALVLVADPASSTGGTLDATFGSGGAARVDQGGTGSFDTVEDLAVQSDGKVVAVGRTTAGTALSRLKADGTLDTTFGTGGSVASTLLSARGVALQSDGKLVVVGPSAAGGGNLVLARYSAAGVLDTTFGSSGSVTVAMTGTGSGGLDVAVQGDGKIVALAVDAGVLTVVRFSAVGVVDATFGSSGRANQTATPTGMDRLAVQGDGKIVLTGLSGGGGVLRLTSAGAADATFGANGVATTANHVPRALAVASSGKIVVAGDFGTSDTKVMVTRRTATGALDTSFATTGVASFAVTGLTHASARAVALQSDGSVVVAGRNDDTNRTSAVFVARLTAAGALDSTFATGGVATFTTVNALSTASVAAVAVDSSGRFLLGGSVVNDHASFTNDNDFLVLRVLGTGTTGSTSTTAPVTAPAGGTVSSDPDGGGATSTNKVVVTVTTPVAGAVSITKTTGATLAGYRNLAGATITAPVGTAAQPLALTFDVDVSTLPDSLPLRSVAVLRDGTAAADCTSTTAATPDPCVLSRTRSGAVVSFSVLSTHASAWTIARPVLQRLFGDDRILSAIAISKDGFAPGKAGAVVLARADDFADALAAVPLAAAKKAPLLLTARGRLDDRVLAEITRVLPVGKPVYVLGGTGALSEDVADRLTRWGFDVQRLAGDDRYSTAVAVATDGLGSPRTVVETTGLSFADALAAGTSAAAVGGAVLLTAGRSQSDATASYVTGGVSRYAIGGPAAAADPDATAVIGVDRYETAVLAARLFFPDGVATIGIASGTSFADALAGGVHAAGAEAPLLLLPPSGSVPIPVSIYLRDQKAPPSAYVYGGTSAIGADIATLLQTTLGG